MKVKLSTDFAILVFALWGSVAHLGSRPPGTEPRPSVSGLRGLHSPLRPAGKTVTPRAIVDEKLKHKKLKGNMKSRLCREACRTHLRSVEPAALPAQPDGHRQPHLGLRRPRLGQPGRSGALTRLQGKAMVRMWSRSTGKARARTRSIARTRTRPWSRTGAWVTGSRCNVLVPLHQVRPGQPHLPACLLGGHTNIPYTVKTSSKFG